MKFEVISGVNTVLEILRARQRRCYEIYIAKGKGVERLKEIEGLAKENAVTIKLVTREEITSLSRVEKNQGVAAKVEPFTYASLYDLIQITKTKRNGGIFLMLDGVGDPQNLGTLIRSAHLTGVDGIILPEDNSAPIGPAASRASSGATEYVPIVREVNLRRTIDLLKENNFWVVGAALEGKSIYEFDFSKDNFLLVLGSEGKGLRRLIRENCDHLLSIPMQGVLGSFNVSAAGAIFMSEMRRQKNHISFSGIS